MRELIELLKIWAPFSFFTKTAEKKRNGNGPHRITISPVFPSNLQHLYLDIYNRRHVKLDPSKKEEEI